MIEIQVGYNSDDLRVWKNRQVDEAVFKAARAAGGDALRKLRTNSSRAVRERKKLKLKTIRASLPLVFPATSSKNAMVQLRWEMKVSGKPVPVGAYPAKQTSQGVMVEINTGRKRLIKGSFLATMRSGHLGVFRRRGVNRLPIRELFTTRVSDVFNDSGFAPQRLEEARIVYQTTFARLLTSNLESIGAV